MLSVPNKKVLKEFIVGTVALWATRIGTGPDRLRPFIFLTEIIREVGEDKDVWQRPKEEIEDLLQR